MRKKTRLNSYLKQQSKSELSRLDEPNIERNLAEISKLQRRSCRHLSLPLTTRYQCRYLHFKNFFDAEPFMTMTMPALLILLVSINCDRDRS